MEGQKEKTSPMYYVTYRTAIGLEKEAIVCIGDPSQIERKLKDYHEQNSSSNSNPELSLPLPKSIRNTLLDFEGRPEGVIPISSYHKNRWVL